MAGDQTSPPYCTQFDPQTGIGVPIAPQILRVTAPNQSAYTFTGTNSFVLGDERVAVLDPGPDDERHLRALLDAIGGRAVEAIVLTHTHRDHCGLARRLMAETGAPLWSGGPHRLSRPLGRFEFNPFAKSSDFDLIPDRLLVDGESICLGGMEAQVVATPGHCANHLAFAIAGSDMVLVGDHVMGWNSTLVAPPDGDLGDYLASLDRVIGLEQTLYVPAHGGEIADGRRFAQALKAHRLARNGQLLEVLANGPVSLGRATRAIYPTLRGRLAIAAGRTLLSHAEYLRDHGQITIGRTLLGRRLTLNR